ncbi:disulfide bond formation protein B [Sulfitobacter pacificus]|uniref:Dihydroneopterin aldolase n=1 Tax=Sulfitobacter pacificus TaxID=1499314 RepID=A0ABQ5VHB3_9RHOB|nr:disulfide bond formation protein B [Sulfitobacter pacificus]GLQ26465.1 dihydroneopterin aldolase [Sulfitobacter pacificus]
MTRKTLILIATFGSAALLLGAFGFQHIGGLAPCKMCLWQRWPHAAAILIGVAALMGGPRLLAWLGALATAITGAIGAYHAGVEWGWWPGPTSCSGGGADLGAMDGGALLSLDTPTGVVMCDEIVWQLFGLSMAGWNAVFAFALTAVWIMAARRA